MKFILVVVCTFAAFARTTVARAHGVCYDPNHASPVTEASIRSDMQKIKDSGFVSVRLYTPTWGNINVGDLAIRQGLNVSLTIPLAGDVEKDIQAAIDSSYRPNPQLNTMVTQIAVGNENLAHCDRVPQQMFDVLHRLKASVPPYVRVGTVQRNTEYLVPERFNMPGFKEFLRACDFLGVNIQPVFTPNTRAEQAIHIVDGQWKQLPTTALSQQIPNFRSKLVIAEVGWPSAGYHDGVKNWGSREGALRFINDYFYWVKQNQLCNDCSFFFQMFNQPQRKDGPFEPHFGLAPFVGEYKKFY